MARATVSLSDLKTKFKGAGVFTMISDESVTSYNAPGRISVLVPGFSKVGWFNRPFLIEAGDVETLRNLYGARDKSLERKGSFFHKSIEVLLKNTPVIALNLVKFNDTLKEDGTPAEDADKVDFLSLSTEPQVKNIGKTTKLYSSFFKKDDWFIPSAENVLANRRDKSIFNLVNLSQQKLSFIIKKAELRGYDMKLKEWYDGNVPAYLDPETSVNDYIIEVIAIVGDYSQISDFDVRFKGLFEGGLLQSDKLEDFLRRQDIALKFRTVGSLIPDFRTKNGENLYIEQMINSSTISHGVVCAIDREQIEDKQYNMHERQIDVVCSSIIQNPADSLEMLSHVSKSFGQRTVIEPRVFTEEMVIDEISLSKFEKIDDKTFLFTDKSDDVYAKLLKIVKTGTHPHVKVKRKYTAPEHDASHTEDRKRVDGILHKYTNDTAVGSKLEITENGDIRLVFDEIVSFPLGKATFKVVENENAVFIDGSPAKNADDVVAYAKKIGFNAVKTDGGKVEIIPTTKNLTEINTEVLTTARHDEFDTYDKTTGDIIKNVAGNTGVATLTREQSDIKDTDLKATISVYGDGNIYVEDDTDKNKWLFLEDIHIGSIENGTARVWAEGSSIDGTMVAIQYDQKSREISDSTNVNCYEFYVTSVGSEEPLFLNSAPKVTIGELDYGNKIENVLDVVADKSNKLSYQDVELIKTFYKTATFNMENIQKISLDISSIRTQKTFVVEQKVFEKNPIEIGDKIKTTMDVQNVVSIKQELINGKKFFIVELDGSIGDGRFYREVSVHELTKFYKVFSLDGFQINPKSIPDGSNKSIREIYSVISETNIGKALSDPEAISFRYIVDTFNGGIEPKCKSYISEIAKKRDICMAIINVPRVDEFKKHKNPRFTASPTSTNPSPSVEVRYIVEGGNKAESPEWLFSLPEEEQGASHSAFFFPNVLVTETDGSTSSIPPASYVASCFMRKFGTTDEYKPSAGIIRGAITGEGVTGVDFRLGSDDYRSLIEFGINPIIIKNGSPIIYGNETGYQRFTSALNNIHARDLLITITEETKRLIDPYVYDYNDDTMRATIRTILNGYYGSLRDAYRAIESFKITIDRTNNPGWLVDNDGVLIDVEVTITGVAKKFINRITLKGRSVNQTGFTII